MHVLVTRPLQDAEVLADVLRAAGHTIVIDPLLSISFKPEVPLSPVGVQALAVTSANGLRALGRRSDFADWKSVPLFAVGPTTAALGRAAGFGQVYEAAGDVVSLSALLSDQATPDAGPILHIAGTVTAGDLKGSLEAAGFQVDRVVLYEAKAADSLADETIRGLRDGAIDAVLLYSRRSADTFADLCEAADLQMALGGLSAYCLSVNAAKPLQSLGLRAIHVAPRPNETELLALIRP
ncbi:MAG: uroporphyrinogen-III synthase [Rhodobiaceae bacterium]|nr:MAG: uroporphyrinogen-III synthase [Rhodobiaceae bacterium]